MLLKAFGESCMSRAGVFDWYKLFKEDQERVIDKPRPDHQYQLINMLIKSKNWCSIIDD